MSSSIFTVSAVIDHSLLSGSARDVAIDAMYRDRFAITHSDEYSGYVQISSPIGARVWELSDPRDYSTMNDDVRGDYETLVNHADVLVSRYGVDELRARASNLYRQAMGE